MDIASQSIGENKQSTVSRSISENTNGIWQDDLEIE